MEKNIEEGEKEKKKIVSNVQLPSTLRVMATGKVTISQPDEKTSQGFHVR